MKAFKLSNTLHLNQQLNSLDDIFSWSEAGVISGKIDNYILKINKSNIDPIILAQTKLKQRKLESAAIIAKVNEIDDILEDNEDTSFKIDLIVTDLSLLQKQLQKRKNLISEKLKTESNMKSQLENIYLTSKTACPEKAKE